MKRIVKASSATNTYKDYTFYVDRQGTYLYTVITDNRTDQTYVTREIQPDDILCIIKAYPDGDLVTPIEDNMLTMRNASMLGMTDILDYLDGRL